MTRQQAYLAMALRHVQDVHAAIHPNQPQTKKTADIYGGLCHSFPILVRADGLCQAVAFAVAKAGPTNPANPANPPGQQAAPGGAGANAQGQHTDDTERARAQAYRLLLRHVGEVLELGQNQPPLTVLEAVRDAPLLSYAHQTRTILAAWVYYKRFAESVLDVKAGEGGAD